jgi:hypothetical protein
VELPSRLAALDILVVKLRIQQQTQHEALLSKFQTVRSGPFSVLYLLQTHITDLLRGSKANLVKSYGLKGKIPTALESDMAFCIVADLRQA